MSARNTGIQLDLGWISKVHINQPAVVRRAEQIQTRRTVKKEWQAAWLLRAVTCIDLTTLSGDDTYSNVQRLCFKAKHPIRDDLLKALDMQDKGITTGAVCVYPARVSDAVKALKAVNCNIPVAAVATGFPAGQTLLKTRLDEVRMAVEDGASEIDIVINRTLALTGQWEALYDEISSFRKTCGEAHMKTILATGELGSLTNVYKASLVAMMAVGCLTSALFPASPGLEPRASSSANECVTCNTTEKLKALGMNREVFSAIQERHVNVKDAIYMYIKKVASSDFIKTSTGKESVNATFPVALVMVRAIRDFYWKTGNKVGFKPAGGIRSAKDALAWLSLMKEELGDEWLQPTLFRIGASTLLSDIERQIYHHVTGRYAAFHDLPMA